MTDGTDETGQGGSDTTSLASSIFKYRVENGRTYHAYKAGGMLLLSYIMTEYTLT